MLGSMGYMGIFWPSKCVVIIFLKNDILMTQIFQRFFLKIGFFSDIFPND
jgi:hypothetical protein